MIYIVTMIWNIIGTSEDYVSGLRGGLILEPYKRQFSLPQLLF